MDDKENKPKYLSCMLKGPAPTYKLPPLVGYDGHDPTKHRNPAFTLRPRTGLQDISLGPGPCYSVAKFTRQGPDKQPAYTILGREPFKIHDRGPGPGAHYPEKCPPMNHNKRSPAYSIKSKHLQRLLDTGPGPNAYILPTCIGPKIPDKRSQGAFSMSGHHNLQYEGLGPGPAGYKDISYDKVKKRCPAFTIKARHGITFADPSPGPMYGPLYQSGKRAPMFSFGIRHSECAGTPITDMDED